MDLNVAIFCDSVGADVLFSLTLNTTLFESKQMNNPVKLFILSPVLLIVASFTSPVFADTCEAEDTSAPYRLVFEDNFDDDELDRNKWNTEYLWGPGVIINNEQQYYVNDNQFGYNPFRMGDGVLSIEAIKAPFDQTELYLTSSIYSATSSELLWRTPAGATHYEVYRDGVLQATVTGGSYFEPLVREGIDYAYEVIALDANNREIVSAQLTINTGDRPQAVPAKPFGLYLQHKVYSASTAELTWDRPNRAGRTDIYRNGELYQSLIGADYTSWYESNLQEGIDYTYKVLVYDRCDELIIEAETSLNTGNGPTPSAEEAQRLVINVDIYSKSTAEISWNAVANAASYDIYENDIFVLNTDGRSVFMDDLVPGVDRRFRVVVLDTDGNTVDETGRVINTADNSFALNRQPYLSGVITSYDSFRFRYGRVEMRAKMPAGKGLWSAFWLLNAYYHQDQPEDPEIDIIEAIGDRTTTANQAYHYVADLDGDGNFTDRLKSEGRSFINDFSADYHVYSVDWSEDLIVWYVDGVEVHRVEGAAVSKEQMYIIANLAVGGWFPGPADETTPFPAKFEIDYIRVYQR